MDKEGKNDNHPHMDLLLQEAYHINVDSKDKLSSKRQYTMFHLRLP